MTVLRGLPRLNARRKPAENKARPESEVTVRITARIMAVTFMPERSAPKTKAPIPRQHAVWTVAELSARREPARITVEIDWQLWFEGRLFPRKGRIIDSETTVIDPE